MDHVRENKEAGRTRIENIIRALAIEHDLPEPKQTYLCTCWSKVGVPLERGKRQEIETNKNTVTQNRKLVLEELQKELNITLEDFVYKGVDDGMSLGTVKQRLYDIIESSHINWTNVDKYDLNNHVDYYYKKRTSEKEVVKYAEGNI
jgi:hypothetical protein